MRPQIYVAGPEIGCHHRDLDERMWRQRMEDLKDRVTIRPKQPPAIRTRIENHHLRFYRGQLATLHVKADVALSSSRSISSAVEKLPIKPQGALVRQPGTCP